MWPKMLLFGFIFIHVVLGDFEPFERVNSEIKFHECLKSFVTKKIVHDKNNVLVTSSNFTNNALNNLMLLRTTYEELEAYLNKLDIAPANYIFVFDQNINNVNFTLSVLVDSKAYSSRSKLLFITKDKVLAQNTAKILWDYKLIRSHIIVTNNEYVEVNIIELIQCGADVKAKQILTLKGSNCSFVDTKVDLKLTLKGCPLHVISGYHPPAVTLENATVKGIFNQMIEVFAEVSDRKLVMRPYNPIYVEEILESYSFTSMVEDFESEYADVFIGAIVITAIDVLDISPPLMSDSLMFLVPRAFISGPVVLFSSSFNFQFMIVISIGITIVILTFYLTAKYTIDRYMFKSMSKTFLIFLGLTLNASNLPRLPKNTLLRIFLVFILFLIMMFTLYLQGILISILNGPFYEPPIKSLREMIHKDVPIKLYPTLVFFFEYANNEYYKEIVERHGILNGESLFESGNILLREKNFATVIYEGFTTMRPNLQKSVSAFEFWPLALSTGMKKKYYMHQEFCGWFTQMVEHGIVARYWKLNKFAYVLKNYVDTESRVYKVTMTQIEPAIFVLLIGYLLSCLIFILERVVYKLQIAWKKYKKIE